MKTCTTFRYTIYCGLKEGYDGPEHSIFDAYKILKKYVDDVGLCVTVKPTKFIYTGGSENGIEVGLINYPRFPDKKGSLHLKQVKEIGKILLKEFKQNRVTIVTDDTTIMIEKSDIKGDENYGK